MKVSCLFLLHPFVKIPFGFLPLDRSDTLDVKELCRVESPCLNCTCFSSTEVFTFSPNDSAVDLVSDAVLFARSIIELVIAEVGQVEDLTELVTETELDLGVGEDWDRMEDGRDDVAATELDLRL